MFPVTFSEPCFLIKTERKVINGKTIGLIFWCWKVVKKSWNLLTSFEWEPCILRFDCSSNSNKLVTVAAAVVVWTGPSVMPVVTHTTTEPTVQWWVTESRRTVAAAVGAYFSPAVARVDTQRLRLLVQTSRWHWHDARQKQYWYGLYYCCRIV